MGTCHCKLLIVYIISDVTLPCEIVHSLRLLHNDVPVVHATATLNIPKSKTNVIFFLQSNILLCFNLLTFYCYFLSIILFFVLQRLN